MNMRRLRTAVAAAMGGALLVTGLLVGASLALAEESDEPDATEQDTTGDSLTRVFGLVQDLLEDEAELGEEAAETDLARIAEELRDDLAPLIEEIKERLNAAIDDAVASGALTEEQAERARDRVEGFTLPERFPFFERGFRFGAPEDFECFGFRFGPDELQSNEDCPEFKLPEGFPFGPDGFEFGTLPKWLELPEDFELPEGFPFGPDGFEFGPFERFGEDLDELVEGLDIDLDELRELLKSGMSLDEALQELGTDLESILAEAREQALSRIDQRVEDGDLTEEQANRIRELLDGIELDGTFPFGLHGFDLDLRDPRGLDGWGRGHGFFGPWEHFSDGEDPLAEETLLDA